MKIRQTSTQPAPSPATQPSSIATNQEQHPSVDGLANHDTFEDASRHVQTPYASSTLARNIASASTPSISAMPPVIKRTHALTEGQQKAISSRVKGFAQQLQTTFSNIQLAPGRLNVAVARQMVRSQSLIRRGLEHVREAVQPVLEPVRRALPGDVKMPEHKDLDEILSRMNHGEVWTHTSSMEVSGHVLVGGMIDERAVLQLTKLETEQGVDVEVRLAKHYEFGVGLGISAMRVSGAWAHPIGAASMQDGRFRFQLPAQRDQLDQFVKEHNRGRDIKQLGNTFAEHLQVFDRGARVQHDLGIENPLISSGYIARMGSQKGQLRVGAELFDTQTTVHQHRRRLEVDVPVLLGGIANIMRGKAAFDNIDIDFTSRSISTHHPFIEHGEVRVTTLTKPSSAQAQPQEVVIERRTEITRENRRLEVVHRVHYKNLETLTRVVTNPNKPATPQEFVDLFVGKKTLMDESSVRSTFRLNAPKLAIDDFIHSTIEVREIQAKQTFTVGAEGDAFNTSDAQSKPPKNSGAPRTPTPRSLLSAVQTSRHIESAPKILFRSENSQIDQDVRDSDLHQALEEILSPSMSEQTQRKNVIDVSREVSLRS